MSRTQPDAPELVVECCGVCGEETQHRVRLELHAESDEPAAAAFSREPYRITTCRRCGDTTTQPMT